MSKRFIIVLMLMACGLSGWSQDVNNKLSLTSMMFLDELRSNTPKRSANNDNGTPPRLIAETENIDGREYIPCFLRLKDNTNTSTLEELGVLVQCRFDKGIITANVPVDNFMQVAELANVNHVNVASIMTPTTNMARQMTNTDDVLTHSAAASAAGLAQAFDGTGVLLGIIDTGIDFQHIAFKDKNDNSRIKRAYVYNSTYNTGKEFVTSEEIAGLTTDYIYQDHGTHTASTAGGSSVIVDGSTVTVTDDHANATYGGMAPGADLYLAGLKSLTDSYLANATQKIVEYADARGMPVVVSNSWGSQDGPHDGTGYMANIYNQYFGEGHPNHIALFASSNDAGDVQNGDTGGYHVSGTASKSSPFGTVVRSKYNDGYYYDYLAFAWTRTAFSGNLAVTVYVLDASTGVVKATSSTLNSSNGLNQTVSGSDLDNYFSGTLKVYFGSNSAGKKQVRLIADTDIQMNSNNNGNLLAFEIAPATDADGSTTIDAWGGSDHYFTTRTTAGHTWIAGSDDMSASDEATIPSVISVGAYMSKTSWKNYNNTSYGYNVSNDLGDIAYFSSYATAAQSPTELAYPWITAPGAMVVAGVNHHHTTLVDNGSYYYSGNIGYLVVNNSSNPYAVMQGTSMATPVAAGIVALWLQAAKEVGKSLTVNDVKTIMQETAIRDSYVTTGANASHFGVSGKIDALAGIKYIFDNYGSLSIANSGDNATAIDNKNNLKANVTLSGRTLYKDGGWNTLCLPFDVTIAGSVLDGAEVRALSTASLNNGTLELNFTPASGEGAVTTMTAGTPYIIRWDPVSGYVDDDDHNLVNPVFNGVTVKNVTNNFTSTDGKVQFIGTYSPAGIYSANHDNLFLGSSNQLYWPDSEGYTINACRAYFHVSDGTNAPELNNIVLNFEENTGTTGITNTNLSNRTNKDSHNSCSENNAWYTMDGRQLVGKPSAKGVYIHAGKKVVITKN
jgi:hypothetical protein